MKRWRMFFGGMWMSGLWLFTAVLALVWPSQAEVVIRHELYLSRTGFGATSDTKGSAAT